MPFSNIIYALLTVSLISAGNNPIIALKGKKARQSDLSPGQTHRYSVKAKKGQALNVLVLQKGIDVVVTVLDPAGNKIRDFDSPTGSNGPESVFVPAEEDGNYILEVKALDPKVPPGSYDIRIRGSIPLEEYRKRDARYDPVKYSHQYLNFALPDGRQISMGPTEEFMARGKLMYVDTKNGRFGLLQPLSDGNFYAAGAMSDDFPVEIRLSLTEENGRITGMDWSENNKKKIFGKRVSPSTARDIEFKDGEVTLKGVLLVPDGPGPHPAVVYAHGSGPATRQGGFFHSVFLKHGIAVLAFDKRGAGESGGDWQKSSLNDLASDLLAGVEFLKTQPGIDPNRIGIYGISQAGWVASLAASRSPDIKFLCINCGSGVSVAENMVFERESVLLQAGLKGSELSAAVDFYRTLLQAASDGKPWEEIKALLEGGKTQPWAKHMSIVNAGPDNMWWNWLKLNGNVDPVALLKDVNCPVLWFLGDTDRNVPSQQSLPLLQAALAGKPGSEVLMMSPATHVMFESKTGYFSEVMGSRARVVPGFWEKLEGWLEQEVNRR